MPKKAIGTKLLRNRVRCKQKTVWITDGGRQVRITRTETKDEAVSRVLRERRVRKRNVINALLKNSSQLLRNSQAVSNTVVAKSASNVVSNGTSREAVKDSYRFNIQVRYTRGQPLVLGSNNRRMFSEDGMIHVEGGGVTDRTFEPEDLLTRIERCVAGNSPRDDYMKAYIPELRNLYSQAIAQRRSLGPGGDTGQTFRGRPSHYSTRTVEDSTFQVFNNTPDVDLALDAIEALTDTIVQHYWGLTSAGKQFFCNVFQSSMGMSQTIYGSQRVSGKQIRAIANWTRGTNNWVSVRGGSFRG